jgi:hypothetical protein
MNRIGDFVVDYVMPDDEKTVGISFEDYVLFDFDKGYLWMWNHLPKEFDTDKSQRGILIIDGVDNMEVI